MNIYESLKDLLDFFIQPFLSLLNDIGISDKTIKVGFGSIEWFSFQLNELIHMVLGIFILYVFFRVIYRLIAKVVKMITGGNYL